MDELAWREALVRAGGPNNLDRLWPVLATGMSDLLQREAAQRAALDEHSERLELLARATRELAVRQRTSLTERIEAIKRREVCKLNADSTAHSVHDGSVLDRSTLTAPVLHEGLQGMDIDRCSLHGRAARPRPAQVLHRDHNGRIHEAGFSGAGGAWTAFLAGHAARGCS